MTYTFHTHLRVPYDICVKHITTNLRKNLCVDIISPQIPDVVHKLPLDSMRSMIIKHMEETTSEHGDCLKGMLYYKNDMYRFKTYHHSYDVVLVLKKTSYPYHILKMKLPISSCQPHHMVDHHDNTYHDQIIYIPSEYTDDVKFIPTEFVWEFLSQLPSYLENERKRERERERERKNGYVKGLD